MNIMLDYEDDEPQYPFLEKFVINYVHKVMVQVYGLNKVPVINQDNQKCNIYMSKEFIDSESNT